MRISKKKQQELYNAIHDEITNIRIVLRTQYNLSAKEDVIIAQLEHPMWKRIREVLGLVN